jgi:hypothetical protein
MVEWWTRDATICAGLVAVLCALVGFVGGPIFGATAAVASLNATALARWTAPPLTQAMARLWSAHAHLAMMPRPPRALTRRAIATVPVVYALNAAVDLWDADLMTAALTWCIYVCAVTVAGTVLCGALAPSTARRYIADVDTAHAAAMDETVLRGELADADMAGWCAE